MNYIHPYRMEGKVKLPWAGGLSISDFWKSKLTDYFIDNIIADDGILVYLSTEEFQHLFDCLISNIYGSSRKITSLGQT